MALKPLTRLLNKRDRGYKIKGIGTEITQKKYRKANKIHKKYQFGIVKWNNTVLNALGTRLESSAQDIEASILELQFRDFISQDTKEEDVSER